MAHHNWGGARWVWDVVSASLHVSPVDQVGASAGDDVAAAHVHGDAYHAVRGDTAACRRDHRGNVGSAGLWVKVRSSTVLSVQLGIRVVGVGRSAGGRSS